MSLGLGIDRRKASSQMKVKMIWGFRASPWLKSERLDGMNVTLNREMKRQRRRLPQTKGWREKGKVTSVALRPFCPPERVTPALVQVPNLTVEVETMGTRLASVETALVATGAATTGAAVTEGATSSAW